MKPFKVGDRVTVTNNGEIRCIVMVRRITKRFVELHNDSKWQPDGRDRFPKVHDPWRRESIRHTTDTDREVVRRVRYAGRLRRTDWATFSVDDLRKVNLLLDRLEKRRAEK